MQNCFYYFFKRIKRIYGLCIFRPYPVSMALTRNGGKSVFFYEQYCTITDVLL